MFEFLSKLSFSRGTTIMIVVFGMVISPYWFLFQFAQEIYKSNDTIQTIILSLCIGIPVCVWTFVLNLISSIEDFTSDDESTRTDSFFKGVAISCGLAGISFYLPCAAKYFDPSINQRSAISLVMAGHAGYIGSTLFSIYKSNKKKKRNRDKNNNSE